MQPTEREGRKVKVPASPEGLETFLRTSDEGRGYRNRDRNQGQARRHRLPKPILVSVSPLTWSFDECIRRWAQLGHRFGIRVSWHGGWRSVRFNCVIGEGKGRLEFRGQDFRYGRVGGENTVAVDFLD